MFDFLKKKDKLCTDIEIANTALDNLKPFKYDPTIHMGNKYWKTYFNIDKLQSIIIEHMQQYPHISEIAISINIYEYINYKDLAEIQLYIFCKWLCGPTPKRVKESVTNTLNDYIKNLNIYDNIVLEKSVYVDRYYPNTMLINCAKKYMTVVDAEMPVNMATIQIVEYKGHSIISIVGNELSYVDDLDSNEELV